MIGETRREARYESGSGIALWGFIYEVQPGDNCDSLQITEGTVLSAFRINLYFYSIKIHKFIDEATLFWLSCLVTW
ncbi:MAG: hypothetical protein NTX25_19650 [Proteobacteria bacterium]|nr:hypothetical protein [Pseudomonadota bacterium]